MTKSFVEGLAKLLDDDMSERKKADIKERYYNPEGTLAEKIMNNEGEEEFIPLKKMPLWRLLSLEEILETMGGDREPKALADRCEEIYDRVIQDPSIADECYKALVPVVDASRSDDGLGLLPVEDCPERDECLEIIEITCKFIQGILTERWGCSGANLSNANLSGANLSRADLSYADICKADLRKADLRNANLTGADLAGVKK